MMKKCIFIGTCCAVVFIFTLSIAFAVDLNQKSGGATFPQKIKTQTALPAAGSVTVKPLATEIKINPNLIKHSIPPAVPNDEFKAILDSIQKTLHNWDEYDGSVDWAIKNCAEKKYSVTEQQAAGCLGSDTVDVCAQKLYNHCMQTSMYRDTYKVRLKTMMDAVDNLIKKSTLYRSGLNEAEKKWP